MRTAPGTGHVPSSPTLTSVWMTTSVVWSRSETHFSGLGSTRPRTKSLPSSTDRSESPSLRRRPTPYSSTPVSTQWGDSCWPNSDISTSYHSYSHHTVYISKLSHRLTVSILWTINRCVWAIVQVLAPILRFYYKLLFILALMHVEIEQVSCKSSEREIHWRREY